MEMRRVTGVLAWAGLLVVVAVPVAEYVRSRLAGDGALSIESSDVAAAPQAAANPPKPAAVRVATTPAVKAPQPLPPRTPAPTPTDEASANAPADAAPADPIGDYLASGKPLPDYITGSTGAKPAPVATGQNLPAALPKPAATPPAADGASVAVASAPAAAPAPLPAVARPKPRTVTEADLKDWKTGSLKDYLREHNLLSADDAPPDDNAVPVGADGPVAGN